ncbi:type II toxin-antitoxin system Phd/YefM family antitoxin [Sphingomonas sp. Leaf25]|uniref:type II toxin-antitoxin system Phd/YefM family antitoxin n=1 Tax=Sphingomonas sp. Leaf25 TaxID=1735692 RepID=UPI000700D110|nr:type II toxin-antitoxin system Phd/YefM family antitoxin [Sphingomonas sp. Leaf25]KQM96464.1 hypothetical protein ASE78_10610 [Sphingomonas sp. Leaf25]
MENIQLCDAQRELDAVIDKVVETRVPVVIERDDGVGVVMVAAGEWATVQATLASEAQTDRLDPASG